MLGLGGFFYFQHPTQLILPAIVVGIDLLILITASIVDITADKVARILTISRHSPLCKFGKAIPFDDIQGVQMGTSVNGGDEPDTYLVGYQVLYSHTGFGDNLSRCPLTWYPDSESSV